MFLHASLLSHVPPSSAALCLDKILSGVQSSHIHRSLLQQRLEFRQLLELAFFQPRWQQKIRSRSAPRVRHEWKGSIRIAEVAGGAEGNAQDVDGSVIFHGK